LMGEAERVENMINESRKRGNYLSPYE